MKISLLMSTYERPDALATVLRSVERQTRRPDELLIGDDGSGPETAKVIREAVERGLNIRHCWEAHQGCRPARMRNLCLAASTGDYVVIIDDDILLHPEFIADHETAAKPGFFVQGSRVLLDEKVSAEAMRANAFWPSFFRPGIGNRKNLIRCHLLSRLLGRPNKGMRGIRTCNFALWRADFFRVNGFNEDFIGWGREDSELAVRLYNAGMRRRNLHFAALGCHIHHPLRSRENLEHNDDILFRTIRHETVRCERGLNLHSGKTDTGEF